MLFEQLPQPDALVAATRKSALVIARQKGHAGHRPGVVLDAEQFLAILHVPQVQRPVGAGVADENPAAARRERGGGDVALVAGDGVQDLAGLQVEKMREQSMTGGVIDTTQRTTKAVQVSSAARSTEFSTCWRTAAAARWMLPTTAIWSYLIGTSPRRAATNFSVWVMDRCPATGTS